MQQSRSVVVAEAVSSSSSSSHKRTLSGDADRPRDEVKASAVAPAPRLAAIMIVAESYDKTNSVIVKRADALFTSDFDAIYGKVHLVDAHRGSDSHIAIERAVTRLLFSDDCVLSFVEGERDTDSLAIVRHVLSMTIPERRAFLLSDENIDDVSVALSCISFRTANYYTFCPELEHYWIHITRIFWPDAASGAMLIREYTLVILLDVTGKTNGELPMLSGELVIRGQDVLDPEVLYDFCSRSKQRLHISNKDATGLHDYRQLLTLLYLLDNDALRANARAEFNIYAIPRRERLALILTHPAPEVLPFPDVTPILRKPSDVPFKVGSYVTTVTANVCLAEHKWPLAHNECHDCTRPPHVKQASCLGAWNHDKAPSE